jgi:hypothetical protein
MYAQQTTTPDIPTLRGEDTLIHQHISLICFTILKLSERTLSTPVTSTIPIFIHPLVGTRCFFSPLAVSLLHCVSDQDISAPVSAKSARLNDFLRLFNVILSVVIVVISRAHNPTPELRRRTAMVSVIAIITT